MQNLNCHTPGEFAKIFFKVKIVLQVRYYCFLFLNNNHMVLHLTGVQGVAKVQSSAEKVLTNVYKADNLGKPPSGETFITFSIIIGSFRRFY